MTVGMLIGGFSTFLGLTDTMYDFFVALGSITIFLTYIISIANIVFKSLKGDTKWIKKNYLKKF